MRAVFFSTAIIGALACGAGTHTSTGARLNSGSAAATTATGAAGSFPSAPADDDDSVWDFIRHWQGAHISPILRPAFLPSGFDPVSISQPPDKQDPDLLSVEYSGPGKALRIEAGAINPSERYQDGLQHPVTVRGHAAVLEVNRGGDPRNGVALWWTEPGKWTSDVGPTVYDHVDYALIVVGLTQEEVLEVAESLAPVGP